ncbi:MAG TPA: prolyl oligopeptidase family serine peptidase [Propionibacteriaceae bacterium]|nr:prolyl oligopeptidase family serine peptidase [Propionibacteriaceae bacterium]
MRYPESRQDSTSETLHGHRVDDPYRWLEDPDSEETRAWVEAQRATTETYLATLPARPWFAETMRRVASRPRAGIPHGHGGWFFLNRNDGTTPQDVWYVGRSVDEVAAPDARVILDPSGWSEDATSSLSTFTVSDDGHYLAVARSDAGSDWQRIHVLDVESGQDTGEPELVTKFAEPTWLPDGSSYLYNAFSDLGEAVGTQTEALGRPRVMRHTLGATGDELVADLPELDRVIFDWGISHDGHWLWLLPRQGTENRNMLMVHPLVTEDGRTRIGERVTLVATPDAEYTPVRSVGEPGLGASLLVLTDLDAPRGRVVSFDLDAAAAGRGTATTTVVPEGDDVISSVTAAGEHLLVERLVDATPRLSRYGLDGTDQGVVELPSGAIVSTDGSPTRRHAYIGVSTVTEPTAAYEVDSETGSTRALDLVDSGSGVAGPYTVQRARARSADGTGVPYFLIRPEAAPTGPSPTLLYGYGGFKIPVLADYRPGWSGWLAAGGVLAIANLRGGGEYGSDWYDDGRLDTKQHVFDDVIAVAEHLVETGVTTTQQLALHGRSNGGLLVGAAMTQRPDLFAVALPTVGVLDLLRFHRFTIGAAWMSDYGNPDDPHDFEVELAYSPLHNVVDGTSYPATLVATGDHDDRVVPLHSHKFTATLQRAQAGEAPVLTRIETSTGHGAGKPALVLAAEWADLLAFAAHHTGLGPPEA